MYLATAAIGVPIHELSHAIAAFLFRHRITKIKFLNTQLGMVAWDTSSINGTCCHRCKMSGFSLLVLLLLLIGAGAVIYLTTKLMLPGLLDTLAWRIVEIPMGITGDPVKDAFYAVQYGISGAGIAILSVSSEPQFWLWMLISSVVAFHSTPSKADMQSAWKGAIAVGVLLTGIVFIFEAYYPLTEMVVGYWLYSVSIMSATIVFSMPWWVILLMIAMVSKR